MLQSKLSASQKPAKSICIIVIALCARVTENTHTHARGSLHSRPGRPAACLPPLLRRCCWPPNTPTHHQRCAVTRRHRRHRRGVRNRQAQRMPRTYSHSLTCPVELLVISLHGLMQTRARMHKLVMCLRGVRVTTWRRLWGLLWGCAWQISYAKCVEQWME